MSVKTVLAVILSSVSLLCSTDAGTPDSADKPASAGFAENLDLQISKTKLSSKECAKFGGIKGEKGNTDFEYDGCVYSLEFRNGGDMELRNLTVDCRYYYEMTESWRANKRESKTVQKHISHSFKITSLSSAAGYTAETVPFILESYSLPSGYYYNNGGAEVVESRPKGLWVRVSGTAPDGKKAHVDFCDPPALASRVTWQ